MSEVATGICRIYLLFLSLYHVTTGIISYFFPVFAIQFYKKIYGCEAEHREQLIINLRPWGALALFAGITGLFAAWNPVRYLGVIIALAVLLSLRVLYRIVLRKQMNKYGGMPLHRNIISITMIFVGNCILIFWLMSL